MPLGRGACMQMGPNLLASRTPLQLAAGCGARQRRSPTGGAAKGIFLKTEMPPSVVPANLPCRIVTWGSAEAAPQIKTEIVTANAKPRIVPSAITLHTRGVRALSVKSDADLRPQLNHAVGRQAEEPRGRIGIGRQPSVQRDAPWTENGPACRHQHLAADEEGGAIGIDDEAIGPRQLQTLGHVRI